jgi:hypothetical protein
MAPVLFKPLAPLLVLCLLLIPPIHAIKFSLPTYRFPPNKCIWNSAHNGALVIVTANLGPGEGQRVDIEIVDSSPQKNVYLSKRDIKAETRLAITTHADGEVGVCFKNFLHKGPQRCLLYSSAADADPRFSADISSEKATKMARIIDLDVDIGAEAVDYKCVAALNLEPV